MLGNSKVKRVENGFSLNSNQIRNYHVVYYLYYV